MAKIAMMFVPTPGVGHRFSTVELAKLFLKDLNGNFSVSILTMCHLIPAWASCHHSVSTSVISLGLDHLWGAPSCWSSPHPNGETFITCLFSACKPLVRDANGTYSLLWLLFYAGMIDVADEALYPNLYLLRIDCCYAYCHAVPPWLLFKVCRWGDWPSWPL